MKHVWTKPSYALAGLAAFGLLAVGPASAADEITVVSWGGAYTKSQVEAYHKPYEKETGVKILSEDYSGGLAEIKAQVESGNVTWDLVDMERADVMRGCDEGLLEPLDHSVLPPAPDGTPAKDDFIDVGLMECGVATIVWSTIYAFDKTKFTGDKPTTIKDFFDLEKFPGKRGLRKTPKVNMEWALIADGVSREEIYSVLSTPEGVERAFKKLDSIKDEVVWWEAGAQPPQLLADGEVVMTSAYNGRVFNAIAAEDKPFAIVWDHQSYDLDLWGIPKGAPNKEAAMKFLAYSTDTQRLADQAKWISYGPARKSSLPLVATYHSKPDLDMKPHMPNAPDNFKTAFVSDTEFWADNQDELNEKFNAWLAK